MLTDKIIDGSFAELQRWLGEEIMGVREMLTWPAVIQLGWDVRLLNFSITLVRVRNAFAEAHGRGDWFSIRGWARRLETAIREIEKSCRTDIDWLDRGIIYRVDRWRHLHRLYENLAYPHLRRDPLTSTLLNVDEPFTDIDVVVQQVRRLLTKIKRGRKAASPSSDSQLPLALVFSK